MPDPLERLTDLCEAGRTTRPLPAAEVRRRGERLRRRRHRLGVAGATVAVAAIASGGFFVTQQVTGTVDRPGPAATTATPTPALTPALTPAPVTRTPSGPGTANAVPVDLTVGLPPAAGDRQASTDLSLPWTFNPCQDAGSQFGQVERERFFSVTQDSSLWGRYARQLAVYPDTRDAQATMSAYFNQSLGKCSAYSRPGEPARTVWERVGATQIDADEVIVAVGRPDDGSTRRSITHVVIARLGRAVVVLSLEGDFTSPARLDSVEREQRDSANAILEQMCRFAADGCSGG